ncbi:MAG TPA: tyrosine--tRNA ligase [Acidimicrobiales bacterium]|jgi:tyrosyl-tRNA synthetase|nr:tyrosine--tRNA ligase [Acidimicrobiales bacterium]
MPTLSEDLAFRGLIHQMTDPALPARLDGEPLTAYAGFDPSAPSLQLGNLVGVLNLVRLQRAGHRPIALAGGGTGMVGDPSGKTEERSLLEAEALEANVAAIRAQLERFLDFDAGALLVDNGEWLWDVGLLEFLRDVGKHFTVNAMIARESVKARLEGREQGISYTEFSYMLLQAYDFLRLFDRHGCRLQLGGSDQWGNIVSGVELIRRVRGGQAYGLTTPLLVDEQGRKLGKTETGTVWLDAGRTSPYQLFQYLLNTPDDRVGPYLRALTLLPRERVEELDAVTAGHPERREGQRALAREVVTLVHGGAEAAAAERAGRALFGEEIAELDEASLLAVFAEAPSTVLPRSALEGEGLSLVEALAECGLTPSRSAARKAVEQGGAYVNNRRASGLDHRLTSADLLHDRYVVLRRGRRDHHLLRVG